MKALNFRTDNPRDLAVDLFVELPFEFDEEFQQSAILEVDQDLQTRVVSLDTLMRMKVAAGRDKDKADLVELRRIKELLDENT